MTVEIRNFTPFANLRFSNTDNRGQEFGVFMIKGAFDIGADGQCRLSDEQEPFNFSDRFHADIRTSSLYCPSDLVSFKPSTDVIVNAVAHAPGGEPSPSWLASVRVRQDGHVSAEKTVRVTGPRKWVPKWRGLLKVVEKDDWKPLRHRFQGWELTDPEPIRELPLRYEHAYGGMISNAADAEGDPVNEAWPYNPSGRGWIDRDRSDHTEPHEAPQIEDPQNPIMEPYVHYPPQGMGAIPPSWLPRRMLGGTYDQDWLDRVWPKWPQDYDFAYNNSAAAELRSTNGYLRLPLTVETMGLRPGGGRFDLSVPESGPLVLIQNSDGTSNCYSPALDTLFIDIAGHDLFECRLMLTWRLVFNVSTAQSLVLFDVDDEERVFLKTPGVVQPSPSPADCACPCDLMSEEK